MDVTTAEVGTKHGLEGFSATHRNSYISPGLKSWAGLSQSTRVAFMNLQTRSSLRALQLFVP